MKKHLLWLLKLIAHALVGTIGVGIITTVLTFTAVGIIRRIAPQTSPRLPHVLLTEVPGFPLQVVVGLVVGYLLWKITKQHVAFWAWIPSVALLLTAIARFASARVGGNSFPQLAVLSLEHFLGGECALQRHCFDQVMYTLPSVAAAAYSLGAFVASCRSRISPSEMETS